MSAEAESDPVQAGLVVLIPIFNDWDAVGLLLADLDQVLSGAGLAARVLLVDDGSTNPAPEVLFSSPFKAVEAVQLLSLRRNVGHQRAIAIGLSHVEASLACRAVVVMDGDGEDAPSDVPRLVQRMTETGDRCVVFAARARRSESVVFRVCYFLYRKVHVMLTGISVRVGNFSVVPQVQLRRLVIVSDLWNHFSAAIHRAKLPFEMVPCKRAVRLSGKPQMNFVALVGHGLSAMSVFGDLIGARMLIASSLMVGFSLAAIAGIALFVGLTSASMSGWEPYAAGLLFFVLMQGLLFSFVFVFIILASRNMSGFIPARDYGLFIEELRTLTPHE
ncbi:MAG: glycosyltransferase involved in cell wall biosynthesis [Planctomycetota bacterium]|jgi:glycosyltransferase involved in cell wall biosynthesis